MLRSRSCIADGRAGALLDPMNELTVETRELDGVTVVDLLGFVNAHTVAHFDAALRGLLSRGRFQIVVNASKLSYIASAGLGAIMGSIEEIRAGGGDLRMSELNTDVHHIFEILGFDRLFQIFGSEGEAVASFGPETPKSAE